MYTVSHIDPGGKEGFHFLEILWDSFSDTVLIFPFLFAAFIFIGMLERGMGRRMVSVIIAADKIGPLAGGLLGAVPSCGFSAAASSLFASGLLTTGTLLSVYLSTSDEMLAVMVAERASWLLILKILAIKVLCAVICGFLVDFIARLYYKIREKKHEGDNEEEEIDEAIDDAMDCGCSDAFCAAKGNLFLSSIVRTLRIFILIFAVTLAINVLLCFADQEVIARFLAKVPVLGCIITAFLGLIPNCAVSVALTHFWLDGVISAPMMLSGLMAGAGSGLIILLRSNKSKLENVTFIGLLLVCSIIFGGIAGLIFF